MESVGWIVGALTADDHRVDVRIEDGCVAEIVPAGTVPTPVDALDLTEHVLLTAPAEPHAHLDKALSWDEIRPPMGDLRKAIDSWRGYVATADEASIAARAERAALIALANGTTAIRSHVDVLSSGDPARGARALVAVRERLSDLMDIELVALPGPDLPDAAIEAVLDAGVDLVGGAPHLADDEDADLRRLLAIAERRGLGVDLHIDESLVHGSTLAAFAAITASWSVRRTAGHCVRLGTVDLAERCRIIDAVRDAGIGIIANPITNLYLQGWDDEVAVPRGLTPMRALLDAGVGLAAGADNVRDPFNPLGRSDAFETAMLSVVAGHLTIDEAWHCVSDGARQVMGLPAAGLTVGARAELLAVRANSLAEAVAVAPADRIVIHRGNIVAQTTVTRSICHPDVATIHEGASV